MSLTMPCRVTLALAAAVAAAGFAAASEPTPTIDRPADHVVLISVDGLRPEFYLQTQWPAPMNAHRETGACSSRRASTRGGRR